MENSKLNYIVSDGVYTPVGNLSNVVQQLPPAVYVIRDFPMQGTKLIKRDNVDTSSPKSIYGKIPSYLEKTFSAFERRRLNTGVLLSGERGMGKTLFVRMAIKRALEMGLAVVSLDSDTEVSSAINILNSVTQPLVVVMDEFEKNFSDKDDDDHKNAQTPFLSMLDGIGASQKRLYIATVNDTYDLSKYLLNRPGRFYYHFEFKSLTGDEMREYLTRETKRISRKTIEYAVSVMQSYRINYDGIAAIAAELNSGASIGEAMHDLNLDREGASRQRVMATFNGYQYECIVYDSLDEIRDNRSYSASMYAVEFNENSDTFPGTRIDVYFDGSKMTMSKHGGVIIPKSAITSIRLNNKTIKKNGEDTSYVTTEDIKVSDIMLRPSISASGAVYMDV